jgi:hypothetical protein
MKINTLITKGINSSLLLGGVGVLTNCGSIIHGTSQDISINSQPVGAQIKIDSMSHGVTPTTVALSRKTSHRVELSKSGYQPYEVVVQPTLSSATVGNVFFGGIIGLAIDSSNGAANNLVPDKIDAVLIKK